MFTRRKQKNTNDQGGNLPPPKGLLR